MDAVELEFTWLLGAFIHVATDVNVRSRYLLAVVLPVQDDLVPGAQQPAGQEEVEHLLVAQSFDVKIDGVMSLVQAGRAAVSRVRATVAIGHVNCPEEDVGNLL